MLTQQIEYMKKIIIVIDGYSACGKSTTAKVVASFLNYAYIDTGAMYRAVTLYFLDHYIDITNPKSVANALSKIDITFHLNPKNNQNETFLNGLNVESEIREMRVAEKVSEVSTLKDVRTAMVAQQQKLGKSKGVVMDGRDIGTVVFPTADLKIFMTADFDIRAERRQKELLEKGELGDIVHNGMEVERLEAKGLKIISREELEEIHDAKVLIRAHGEPPETYKLALQNNIELIDASCPVVLKLQNRVKNSYDQMEIRNGQIVIYGKPGHAEVIGLTGQTKENAIIVMEDEDLNQIDFSRPVTLYSQTTKSTKGFYRIKSIMKSKG